MNNNLVITPEDQDILFREAHTPQAFTDEPVTDEQLQAVYDLIQWGPTSMNTQPLRVVAVRSAETRAKLVEQMMGGNQEKTSKAPLTLVFAADLDFHENLPHQFPAVPNVRDMFEGFGRDGRESGATLNTALQIAYWIIGLRAAGFAVGAMTGFNAPEVDKLLFPSGQFRSLVVANVGHPDDSATFPRGPRLPFGEVVTTV